MLPDSLFYHNSISTKFDVLFYNTADSYEQNFT